MAMRRLGWNHGSECPVDIACVYGSWTTETLDAKRNVRIDTLKEWSLISIRWESDEWTRRVRHEGKTAAELWDCVQSYCRKKSTLWLFGHGMQQQSELLGMLREIESQRMRWTASPEELEEEPDIVKRGVFTPDGLPWMFRGWFHGKSLRVVDICNYTQATIEQFGHSVGLLDDEHHGCMIPDLQSPVDAHLGSIIIEHWITDAINLWRRSDIGTWQTTASKLALNAFKHYTYKVFNGKEIAKAAPNGEGRSQETIPGICAHDDERTKSLERSAYHGGQAECYRYGAQVGPFYHYDVRCMYPYLATNERMPVRHYVTRDNLSVNSLRELAVNLIAIADVTVHGVDANYPLRVTPSNPIKIVGNGQSESLGEWYGVPGTIYPSGRYRTTLAGVELTHALDHGHVEQVHMASFYVPGYPFGDFFHQWHERRCRAEDDANDIAASLCKLVMNSLIGKLGERASVWDDCPGMIPSDPWRQFYAITQDGTKWERFRALGWNVQRHMGFQELQWSSIFLPACVTAAGRIHMRNIVKSLPEHSVVMMDTDGIIVTQAAHDIMQVQADLGNRQMGQLRYKESCRELEIIGPRHYRWDDTWVMSGLRKGWEWAGPGRATSWVSDWLFSRMHDLPHGTFAARMQPWDTTKHWCGRYRTANGLTVPLAVDF